MNRIVPDIPIEYAEIHDTVVDRLVKYFGFRRPRISASNMVNGWEDLLGSEISGKFESKLGKEIKKRLEKELDAIYI